jgi:hypothetical protein
MLNWKDDEQYVQCLALFVTLVGLMFGVGLIAYFGD